MSVWTDLVGGGLVKPLADAGVEVYKDRGQTRRTELTTGAATQQSQVAASAAINAGSSTWRPKWMHSIRQLLSMYFILSFVGAMMTMTMLVMVFAEYIPYAQWAAVKSDFEWFLESWAVLGGSLITVATWSFLGYSPFRSIFDKGNTEQAIGIVESIKNVVPSRKAEVVREEMPEPGKIERIPGVQPKASYFSRTELECKGMTCNCNYPGMSNRIMAMANDLRKEFGPLIVNSGYRCPIHNEEVGGTSGSYHMKGRALDLRSTTATPQQLYDYLCAKYKNRHGFGLYKRFIHMDDRDPVWARKESQTAPWIEYGDKSVDLSPAKSSGDA